MDEVKIDEIKEHEPDGRFTKKIGHTTYKVNIFFKHKGESLQEKIKKMLIRDVRNGRK